MTLKRLIPLLLLAAATAAPAQETGQETGQQATGEQAQAQAEVQAAAANATLAMKLCLDGYRDPEALLQSFRDAGFAYETEDFGGGPADVLHWFSTPSGHVRTAITAAPGAVECRIGTGLWGVEAMLPFAKEAFARLAGAELLEGAPEGQNVLPGSPEAQNGPCSGFHALLPQRMLWLQILRQGNDGTCRSDGTSVMRMML